METPDIQIEVCGYSCHFNSFSRSPKNGAQTYIFRLQMEGACQFRLEENDYVLKPGDLVLLKPGDHYGLHFEAEENGPSRSGDFFILVYGAWIDAWWHSAEHPALTRIMDYESIRPVWHLLVMEHRRLDGGQPELKISLLQSLCYLLDRLIAYANVPYSIPTTLALGIKHYIEANATKPIRLKDAAGHVGLSISRAVYLFKLHFGMSIIQYTHQIRLNIAVELMKSYPMSLEQIAEAAGFGSYTYFHRVFRAHYQISPGAFRKHNYS